MNNQTLLVGLAKHLLDTVSIAYSSDIIQFCEAHHPCTHVSCGRLWQCLGAAYVIGTAWLKIISP